MTDAMKLMREDPSIAGPYTMKIKQVVPLLSFPNDQLNNSQTFEVFAKDLEELCGSFHLLSEDVYNLGQELRSEPEVGPQLNAGLSVLASKSIGLADGPVICRPQGRASRVDLKLPSIAAEVSTNGALAKVIRKRKGVVEPREFECQESL